MKIGITGDTHRSMQAMRKMLQLTPPVELWLHAGDNVEDANVLKSLTKLPVIKVMGNCDFPFEDETANQDELFELEGFKLWLTHGHKYIERNEKAEMAWWARQFGVDIAVYGHTHVPVNEYNDKVLLVNPGSPSRPRGGSRACFAVLTLQRGQKPQVEYYYLEEEKKQREEQESLFKRLFK